MTYRKQTWRDYDDTKTEIQNLNNGAVVTPERMNHIETGIANSANKEEVTAQLAHITHDILSRGVSVLNPPEGYEAAIGDGVADDTQAIQTLINNFDIVILPINHRYRVTDTIYLRQRRKTLTGTATPSNSGENIAELFYDGEENRKKAVVVIGQNDVGEEPTADASGLILKDVVVNGNDKAGFGVYGTYLTNETTVQDVIAKNTLEYGQYYARSWYARFNGLVAVNNWNKGLSFGIPITYQNGETVSWSTQSPLEMNNTPIRNIRAIRSGRYFSEQTPNPFDVTQQPHRKNGYGIGLGIGYGLDVENYTSEASGGVNLYVYTGSEEVKSIRNGYLENTMNNSNTLSENKTNMIIEHVSNVGGKYTIENVFMNYNSGGIHFTGEPRKVLLKNVHQPRFLKSLDDLTSNELYAIVLKDNVYYQAGQYNTDEAMAIDTHYELDVDVNHLFEFQVPRLVGGGHMVFAKLADSNTGNQPKSTLRFEDLETGENVSYPYQTLTKEWKFLRTVNGRYNQISMGGIGGEVNTEIDFKIVTMPHTY